MQNCPRPEYPRPQLVRRDWMNLNGEWMFEIDHGKSGEARALPKENALPSRITVPFCPESDLSGVGYKDFMECVWYKKRVAIPDAWKAGRVLLHIGACDYESRVWVNGELVGDHRGGYTAFSFDITLFLTEGENDVTVRALDENRSRKQPVGKQCRNFYSRGCSYTRTTGIWQTVWLEHVPESYVIRTKYTPDIDACALRVEADCVAAHGKTLACEAYYEDRLVGRAQAIVRGGHVAADIALSEKHLWGAGDPKLYGLRLTLDDDVCESYFGLRSIVYADGKLLLNGEPVYQRLILDQGFYPDGIYTAPTDEDLIRDITRSMDMGFNGARLHQKIFEPRFLYHCDRAGYLVWGEHANWGLDIAEPAAWRGFLPEWLEALRRDVNHPAIIGWCPLNETQQNQDEAFVKMLADMTRAFDPTRPVIDASGWYHVGAGDLVDAHCYEQDPAVFKGYLEQMARGEGVGFHVNVPTVATFMSEFGGTWWSSGEAGWGYGKAPESCEEFIARFRGLVTAALEAPNLCAFCYTQLTDVEQEQNGLYTYDRKPKFNPAVIAEIVRQKAAIEN